MLGRVKGMRRTRVWAAALAGSSLLLGLVAFSHTRAARPLLKWLGLGSGCPMSLAGQTPQTLDRSRTEAMRALAGTDPAPERPAFGFVLGKSTRDEVAAWATAKHVECADALLDTALRCRSVPAEAAGAFGAIPIADLFFRFDAGSTLVAVDVMHQGASSTAAAAFVGEAADRLTRDVGAPASVSLEPPSVLETRYAQSSVAYRFRNYAADVSATNFGGAGIVVREQYRAID